jgi:hypothetical protein
VSRPIVQNQLLELGLRQQQAAPFIRLHVPTGTYGAVIIRNFLLPAHQLIL